MRTQHLLAGVVTVGLTAASLAGLALTQPRSLPRSIGTYAGAWAGRCAVPALAGQTVTVVAADMGGPWMMGGGSPMRGGMILQASPQRVPAGVVSFALLNQGSLTHELVLLPLGKAAAVGSRAVGSDGRVGEGASLGEASNDCGAGSGEGVRPGGAGWFTVTLAPGRYELLCNLPGHYAAGMYTELDVT